MRASTLKIKNIRPPAAIEGGRVVIEGTGFDPEASGTLQVTFDGVVARPTLIAKNRLVIEVPEDAKSGTLVVSNNKKASNPYPYILGRKLSTSVNPVDSPVYDSGGNLYVAYSGKRDETVPVSVYKISSDGTVTPFITNIPNATSMAFGPDGMLYVSSRFEGIVYRSTPDADVTIFTKDLGVPTGLAFDSEGNLFVGDRNGRILKVSPDGTSSMFAEVPESMIALHLAFDLEQNLIVSSPGLSSYDHLLLVDRYGKVIQLHGGFGRPQGLTVDKQGNIYVCEAKAGESGVYKITPSGEMRVLVSGPVMVGVALDKQENLAVTSPNAVYHVAISEIPPA